MRVTPNVVCSLGVGLATFFAAFGAAAATYEVGPGKKYAELTDIAKLLKPGDIVEVQGDHTYKSVEFNESATAQAPVVVRGVRVNGKRPVISGGDISVLMHGNYYTLEGFEVTAGAQMCVGHKANQVTLRDVVVHDCPAHGVYGTDSDSGTLTVEYSEFYRCGNGTQKHSLYISTDQKVFPGSVFRLQHSYVHDSTGGNSVKTRAERNEIYSNWLEGGTYYELDMVGPDDGSDDSVKGPREDGDVVGNVFLQVKSDSYVVRVGGDGTARTGGRYRFVNNTFVHGKNGTNAGALRLSYALDSVEFYNNIFYSPDRPIDFLFRETELTWTSGRQIVGSNNWISEGAQNIPATLTDSVMGKAPGFVDLAKRDLRLAEGSAAIDKGADATARTGTYAFPRPLARALFTPPLRVVAAVGKASARATVGKLDIGAFEFGSPTEEPGVPGTEPPVTTPDGSLPPAGNGGENGTPGAAATGEDDTSGCGCRTVVSSGSRDESRFGALSWASASGLLAALALVIRRRSRQQR